MRRFDEQRVTAPLSRARPRFASSPTKLTSILLLLLLAAVLLLAVLRVLLLTVVLVVALRGVVASLLAVVRPLARVVRRLRVLGLLRGVVAGERRRRPVQLEQRRHKVKPER